MSVQHIIGDLLDWPQGINVIGSCCNAQGVQGSGLAKAIRDKHPEVFHDYRTAYEQDGLPLGSMTVTTLEGGKKVACLITQRYYRKDPADKTRFVDYEALYTTLTVLRDALEHGQKEGRGPYVLGLPYLLSADRAGGDWLVVEAMIQSIFATSPIPVFIVHLP